MHETLRECASKRYILTNTQLASILGYTSMTLANIKRTQDGTFRMLGYKFTAAKQRRIEWMVEELPETGTFERF